MAYFVKRQKELNIVGSLQVRTDFEKQHFEVQNILLEFQRFYLTNKNYSLPPIRFRGLCLGF